MSRKNPHGVRTVTVIVTHENPAKDFSRTYTNRQISEQGAGYTDHAYGSSTDLATRDWYMTTIEDERIDEIGWSLPERKA